MNNPVKFPRQKKHEKAQSFNVNEFTSEAIHIPVSFTYAIKKQSLLRPTAF